MSQYDNNLSGVLFKNDKQGNEKRPDYKGSCEIYGNQLWVSAWVRDKKDGSGKYMSLKFEPKDGKESKPAKVAAGVAEPDTYPQDDIPW